MASGLPKFLDLAPPMIIGKSTLDFQEYRTLHMKHCKEINLHVLSKRMRTNTSKITNST